MSQNPSTPAETPTPTPTSPPTVDPLAFVTQIDNHGEGVDFDSVDGNVRCGIWLSYERFDREDGTASEIGPYAGCRPFESSYETDPSNLWGEVGCSGGQLFGALPAEPACSNGQMFVGEDPSQFTVGVLPVGSSIRYGGYTCMSVDDGTIECRRDSDDVGFSVGRDAYRYL